MYLENDNDFTLESDAPGFGLTPSAPEPEPELEPVPEPTEGDGTAEKEPPPEPEPQVEEAQTGEDEPPPEPEPEPAPEPAADPDDKLKGQKVPYKRFREAVEKERARVAELQERLQKAEERLGQQDTVDIDPSNLAKLGELLIEGKTEDYARGLQEILQQAVQSGIKAATERSAAVADIARTEADIAAERTAAANEFAARYDVFNPQAEGYDPEVVEEAILLRDAYERRGLTPRAAIERAVDVLSRTYDLQDKSAPPPAPAAPVAPPPPRRTPDVSKKLAAAAAQPPVAQGAGELDKPTLWIDKIANMTDDEYDKVPQEIIDRIQRGERL